MTISKHLEAKANAKRTPSVSNAHRTRACSSRSPSLPSMAKNASRISPPETPKDPQDEQGT